MVRVALQVMCFALYLYSPIGCRKFLTRYEFAYTMLGVCCRLGFVSYSDRLWIDHNRVIRRGVSLLVSVEKEGCSDAEVLYSKVA